MYVTVGDCHPKCRLGNDAISEEHTHMRITIHDFFKLWISQCLHSHVPTRRHTAGSRADKKKSPKYQTWSSPDSPQTDALSKTHESTPRCAPNGGVGIYTHYGNYEGDTFFLPPVAFWAHKQTHGRCDRKKKISQNK